MTSRCVTPAYRRSARPGGQHITSTLENPASEAKWRTCSSVYSGKIAETNPSFIGEGSGGERKGPTWNPGRDHFITAPRGPTRCWRVCQESERRLSDHTAPGEASCSRTADCSIWLGVAGGADQSSGQATRGSARECHDRSDSISANQCAFATKSRLRSGAHPYYRSTAEQVMKTTRRPASSPIARTSRVARAPG